LGEQFVPLEPFDAQRPAHQLGANALRRPVCEREDRRAVNKNVFCWARRYGLCGCAKNSLALGSFATISELLLGNR
jgi:hypothetical protein